MTDLSHAASVIDSATADLKRDNDLAERDAALRYELEHNVSRIGQTVILSCGCKAIAERPYWMDGYRHFTCGEIEPCEGHREEL